MHVLLMMRGVELTCKAPKAAAISERALKSKEENSVVVAQCHRRFQERRKKPAALARIKVN
jgi:hypothetical protein